MIGAYILVGQTPVKVPIEEAAAQFEDGMSRRVAGTYLPNGAWVSTVFLAFDHSFFDGPPLLFETMVFWEYGTGPELQERYSTWLEAEEGHRAVVAEVSRPRYWLASLYYTARAALSAALEDFRAIPQGL